MEVNGPGCVAGDGTGYEFLADSVLQVDKINRQVRWAAQICDQL